MTDEEYLHNTVKKLSQLIKERNHLIHKFKGLCNFRECARARYIFSKIAEFDDKITIVIDNSHTRVLESLPKPGKESITTKAKENGRFI